MNKTVQKINEAETNLNNIFFNREEIIRGLFLAILTKTNITMLGVPGTAKSYVARKFASMFNYIGSDGSKPYFESEVHEFTTPTTIYGPIDMNEYSKNKVVKYVTDNFLPNARIGFIDELARGKEILETLLPIIHERVFAVNGVKVKIPLEMTISASNHKLSGSRFQALRDRFLQWFVPEEIDHDNLFNYMTNNEKSVQLPSFNEKELQEARKMVQAVSIPDNIMRKLIEVILTLINQHDIVISDRRKRQIIPLIKAEAFLNGRTVAKLRDCKVIWSALWEDDTQIKTVRSVVNEFTVPEIAMLEKLKEEAIILVQQWKKEPVKLKTTDVSDELKKILKKINSLNIDSEDQQILNNTKTLVSNLQLSVATVLTAEMQRLNI